MGKIETKEIKMVRRGFKYKGKIDEYHRAWVVVAQG